MLGIQGACWDEFAGYSVSQLATSCRQLAAAASTLPNLRHISLGMELDALVSNSRGQVLAPLSALTQLTSLALSDYQHMHPDSPAHEGYYVVPPVVESLAQLVKLDLRLCSGHKAQLQAAAAVPDVSLVLTLARHEQEPFNRCGGLWCWKTNSGSMLVHKHISSISQKLLAVVSCSEW